MRKPTIWVPTRSNTNRAVLSQKMVRGCKFCIKKVEELYYSCSENKGADQLGSYCEVADQLRSYCEADLRLCFPYADCWFSHVVAQLLCNKKIPSRALG